jgi:hypothetical protein
MKNIRASNRLSALAVEIERAHRRAKAASVEAASQYLEMGSLLIAAKAECNHGQWLPFLEMAGVAERQAQRLMRVARSGLKSDTVSDLGGVGEALRLLSWLASHPDCAKYGTDEWFADALINGRILRDAEAQCPGTIESTLDRLVDEGAADLEGAFWAEMGRPRRSKVRT